MTEHVTANPYASPGTVTQHAPVRLSLLDLGRLALATLGISLLTLTVFGSLVWDGTISIFPLHDQAHLISLMTSVGLAISASLSQIIGQMTKLRYGSTLIFATVASTAIAYFAWASWPVAIYYTYFDLSNVFALYTAIALAPALIVAAPVARERTGWIACASFVILGALVLYVVLL